MPVPEELMAILRCIECYSTLDQGDSVLRCTGCGLNYPVEGDIPVMLPEAAYHDKETS